MKNWKTTLGGVMTTVGLTLKTHGSTTVEYWLGEICSLAGPLLLGLGAKDSNVTGGTVKQ